MTKFNKITIFIFAALSIIFASCEPNSPEGDNDQIFELPTNTYPDDLAPDNEINIGDKDIYSYCSDKILQGASQDDTVKGHVSVQSAAIKIPANKLLTYASNRMIKIAVGLHKHNTQPSTNYDNLVVWIRTNLDSENVFEQRFDGNITLGQWHEVVLSPYFKVNAKAVTDIYVGYTISADRYIIGGDGNKTPSENATFIFDCTTNKWINYDGIGNLSIKAIFAGDHMPKNDLSLVSLKAPKYIKPDNRFSVVGIVKNELNNEIKSFDFVALCGGKESRNHVELPWALRKGEQIEFLARDLKLPNVSSDYVEYYAYNINGTERDDNMKNSTFRVNSVISNNLVERITLLENTTGDACSACPTGHRYIDEAVKELGSHKFIWVAHHSGFNRDEFTSKQSDSVAMLFYNSPMGQYAPGLMIDRTNLLLYGAVSQQGADGPIFILNELGSKNLLKGYLDVMQTEFSPIKLNLQHTYNEKNRELMVTVNGSVVADCDKLELGIILLEDNLEGKQAGIKGTYIHNNVCRDGMTSILGNKLNVVGGQFNYTVKKKVNPKFNIDNVSVVAWVANRPVDRFDPNGHVVYQAVKVKVK